MGMKSKGWKYAVPAAFGVLALAAAGCGGSSKSSSSGGGGGNTSGGGGGGGTNLTIVSDFPDQAADKAQTDTLIDAIKLYIKQQGGKAGKYTITYKPYDDATAAAGSWDPTQCGQNAHAYVDDKNIVGIIGTFNSGCAKIILPVVNQASGGPIAMVSPANTNPGLTKAWDAGEPQKYYPSGKRNYTRVVATDDYQGKVIARFMKEQGIQKVFILNDQQTYGSGVAKATAAAAKALGLQVLGNDGWNGKAPNYVSQFQRIKGLNPDAIVLSGIDSLNGVQLIKDKVKVLGDNTKVKLIGPDGFQTDNEKKIPEATGMYTSLTGLGPDELVKRGGKAAAFLAAYKAAYPNAPVQAYTLYGAAAAQVLLKAIAASDGTRGGITDQLFKVQISKEDSLLGAPFGFDKNGDTTLVDASISVMKNGSWTTAKVYAAGS
jgi:branched-chain amino acid transport system substrate-binding protein